VNIADRIKRYEAIEQARQRPLIVYATSTRPNVSAIMAGDAVREFIDQIDAIKSGSDAVDILLHSTGGDALAAWKLMSILREKFQSVSVLVPFMAFSAATLFTLGADEIVMHPHASLGPIDPQITIKLPDGTQRGFSFEDVGAFLRFLADDVRISEQVYTSVLMDKLFSVVDPVHVGGAKRASELSTDVGERLLQMHMKDSEERPKARAIAEGLNKSFFAHSDAVSKSRARALQLKIAKDDAALETLIWQAYLGLESYMDLRRPFNLLQHYIASGGAASLAPKGPLILPPNAPPELANQLWNQLAQQAVQAMSQPSLEVDYTIVGAVIESPRLASEYRTSGSVSAVRVTGGTVQLSPTDKESGWRTITVPAGNPPEATGQPANA
jgi:hypothetical protein